MIELLALALLGCLLGIATGLIPGIHVNTLSALILSAGFAGSTEFAVLVVAMGVTHSFIDFIPAIVFGAPGESNFLSVLPGHRLLLEGKGLKAIQLTLAGGLIGGIFSLLLVQYYYSFVQGIEGILPKLIPPILLIVIGFMLFSKRGARKILFSGLIIGLSGGLGIACLRLNPFQNSLATLIIGFFAISTIIFSLSKKTIIKKQETGRVKMNPKNILEGSLLSVVGASTVSLFPGIGPSQAAFILKKLGWRINTESFLAMLGGINTSNIIFSLAVMLAIGKTRTGIAVLIKDSVSGIRFPMLLFAGTILLAFSVSIFSAIFISRKLLKNIHCIPYKSLNLIVLFFLIALISWFSGAYGLIVSFTAASVSLIAQFNGVKRSNCMAFLIFPALLFYLGI